MAALKKWLHHEATGGVLLLLAAIAAMVASNSALNPLYQAFLHFPVRIDIGSLSLNKPAHLWINDLLMALFFFLVGLELKRELLTGRLSRREQAVLPLCAAVGGMALPALIFMAFNHADPVNMRGWAIPAATDIAFALGVVALLGHRVVPEMKVFLLALAILDDLGAILIIAFFYTANLALEPLAGAGIALTGLILLNKLKIVRVVPYAVLGLVLWLCIFKSGIHATLAGVLTALTIPLRPIGDVSLLRRLEGALHPYVIYLILPLFAFANAGVSLAGLRLADVVTPLPLGIALGLFLGKQLGVFGASWLAVKSGLCRLPAMARWRDVYGIGMLAGIGFTMSLFIGELAFTTNEQQGLVRLGVLGGSLLSAVVGYAWLRMVSRSAPANTARPEGH